MACRDVEQANAAASHIRAEVDAQVRKSARVAHDSDWEHGVDYVATGTVEVRLFSHRRLLLLLLPPILLLLAPPCPSLPLLRAESSSDGLLAGHALRLE